jgi:predicted transcriptional regulator of viral defense system
VLKSGIIISMIVQIGVINMPCHEESIFQIISKNSGYVTAKEVTEAGIPRRCLTKLVESGKLLKAKRGIYVLPDVWEDELYLLQYRFSKGIFSHDTALYLHGLTDRTPISFTMTFPFGYNTGSVKKQGVIPKVCTVEVYSLGIVDIASPSGNIIKSYDVERTLCDMVKETHHGDIQVINQAMKKYAAAKEKNIVKLMSYAEKLRVAPKISNYMEILL